MNNLAKYLVWTVLAVTAFLLLIRTYDVPLYDPDETRFARTTQEMSRSKDLVVPTFEGKPRIVKPPLLHWIQMPVFELFGVNRVTARLPSNLATLASILIVAWVARRRFGQEGAFWAALVLGTMPLVIAVGRLGTMDALLSVHVLGVVALDIAEPEEVGPYRSLAIGLLCGLAFLAKGPVGVVLPLLIMLAGRTASGRKVWPGALSSFRALGGWFAVVLPWGLAFLKRTGAGTAASTLKTEALDRFFAGTGSMHVEPPWFYLGVLLLGFMPWVTPMTVAMVRVLGHRKDPAARTGLYAGAGMLAGLLFFTICQGKLPNYLLPLAPMAALLVTWELGRELDDPHHRRLGPAFLSGTLAAFAALLLIAGLGYLSGEARQVATIGSAIYSAGFLASLIGVVAHKPRVVFGAAATVSALFLLTAFTVFIPSHSSSRSSWHLVRAVPELSENRPLAVVDMDLPSLTYYLDRVPEKLPMSWVGKRLQDGGDLLLVFDRDDLPMLPHQVAAGLREVGEAGKYVVMEPLHDRRESGNLLDGSDPPR